MGKYDIVHVQLFACIVKGNDPAPLVKNLMSLLSKCISVIGMSYCAQADEGSSQSLVGTCNGTTSISRP